MQTIPLSQLALAFIPVALVLLLMWHWDVRARDGVVATLRMLAQLLLVGYVLTFIFTTDNPLVVVGVVLLMIVCSAWIALRPLPRWHGRLLAVLSGILGMVGIAVLMLMTQLVLDASRWYEPSFVVPLAGMIFANAMNTASLAGERFYAEIEHDVSAPLARKTAFQAAVIPQINALLAVGLVSLPGMMTGQILSGVDPHIAARYQIMVMCMLFGSSGLSAALFVSYLAKTARVSS